MTFSRFKSTLNPKMFKRTQMKVGRLAGWICNGDEEKCQHFLYIRPVWRFFVSASSYKVHSFRPDVSFLMTFKCLHLWALTVVIIQPTMANTKCLIQTSPLSQFTHRTVHFIKIYTKDEG